MALMACGCPCGLACTTVCVCVCVAIVLLPRAVTWVVDPTPLLDGSLPLLFCCSLVSLAACRGQQGGRYWRQPQPPGSCLTDGGSGGQLQCPGPHFCWRDAAPEPLPCPAGSERRHTTGSGRCRRSPRASVDTLCRVSAAVLRSYGGGGTGGRAHQLAPHVPGVCGRGSSSSSISSSCEARVWRGRDSNRGSNGSTSRRNIGGAMRSRRRRQQLGRGAMGGAGQPPPGAALCQALLGRAGRMWAGAGAGAAGAVRCGC